MFPAMPEGPEVEALAPALRRWSGAGESAAAAWCILSWSRRRSASLSAPALCPRASLPQFWRTFSASRIARETRAYAPEAHRRHRQRLFQRIALARPTRSAPPGRLPAQPQNSPPPQSRCFGSQACFRMLPESIARFSRPRVVVCRSRSHPCRLRTQGRALPPLRLPARRHGNIRRITQAGRPTYYCPARQE